MCIVCAPVASVFGRDGERTDFFAVYPQRQAVGAGREMQLRVTRVAIADPRARKSSAPITAPITVRVDTRSKAQRRTEQLLNTAISDRSLEMKLWDHLSHQWGLAPMSVNTRRWTLYQAVLTQAAEAEGEWNRTSPSQCGPGPRTHLVSCTPRDTCSRHREHLGLWQDALERFTDYLHHTVPTKAAEDVETEPRKNRRRSVK